MSGSLTPGECKALRVALIFGDPKHASPSDPDPTLESAKAKLKAIEAQPDERREGSC